MEPTNIIVFTGNNVPIGACQSLTIKESRSLDGDGYAIRLEVPRMRLDRLRLGEVFARSFFHVSAQKYPMHIVVLENEIETIRATNVWVTGVVATFQNSDWIIAEGIELECESVSIGKSSDEAAGT